MEIGFYFCLSARRRGGFDTLLNAFVMYETSEISEVFFMRDQLPSRPNSAKTDINNLEISPDLELTGPHTGFVLVALFFSIHIGYTREKSSSSMYFNHKVGI